MSFIVSFLGAGSVGFTRVLLRDLLSVPEFANLTIRFMDTSAHNLEMVRRLCQRDIDSAGLNITIEATTDRRQALKGARYVVTTFRIGGLDAFRHDIEVPLRYGVDQCVGDTLAAGGIFYGQRGIAALLEVCKDIREVAEPNALLLNYSNPMAMMTWAANQYGGVRCIGLCHGVQAGHHQIAEVLGLLTNSAAPIPLKDVDINCVGINHQTWYTRVLYRGEEWADRLAEGFERHPTFSKTEKCRIDVMKRFGYYSTESNGHLSEYLMWYRKRPEHLTRWIDLDSWIDGETGGYLRYCQENRAWFETDFPRWLAEPPYLYAPSERSEEHGSYIVEALETGRVYRGHFNVVNRGAVPNLPADAIVEVPGFVNRLGLHIPPLPPLPSGPAAICSQSIGVQRLAVEAAVRGDDLLLRQALLLDPLTGAVCTPEEIDQMADELLVAEAAWLPQYPAAISRAQARLAQGLKVAVREGYRGAARKAVRSVEDLRQDDESRRAQGQFSSSQI